MTMHYSDLPYSLFSFLSSVQLSVALTAGSEWQSRHQTALIGIGLEKIAAIYFLVEKIALRLT
jgi:hypothetical protein